MNIRYPITQIIFILLISLFILPPASAINSTTGAYTQTFTNLSNGSWVNLSQGIYAISGSVNFSNYTAANNTATGGTITYVGNYTIHTFTTGGTFHPNGAMNVEALVVAGGAGGATGGGGAGGLLYNSSFPVAVQNYTIAVGTGGTAGTPNSNGVYGGNGNPSSFSTMNAVGGGGGATGAGHNGNGGGSGGGGGGGSGGGSAGSGTAGQGNAGGARGVASSPYPSGAGGGAGGVGACCGGNGGVGLMYNISGSNVYYAGGGGAGYYWGTGAGNIGGLGGNGGGGNGSAGLGAVNGTDGLGGGGGGGSWNSYYSAGARGGSGVVIIRYLTQGGNNNVYVSPQNHSNSENKTSGATSISVNLSINTTIPIQNFMVFKSTDGTFDVTLNLLTNQTPIIESESVLDGYYYHNMSLNSSIDISNVTITGGITNTSFKSAAYTGALSVSSTDSNITSSGWSQWNISHNSSFIPTGVLIWYNSTITYNTAPSASLNNISCIINEACSLEFNSSDAENNPINISTIINGTTKYGVSPHDWSGLSIGTHTGTLWVNETSNTVNPLLNTSVSFQITILPTPATPPTPVLGSVTTGNFWVNTAWSPGSGNITDTYNVSYNGVWINGSSAAFKNTTLSAHGWHNVTVYAYNNSGYISTLALTNNTQIPNNVPVMTGNFITPTTAYSYSTLTSTTHTATDADDDPITYTYQWYKNDILQSETGSSFTGLVENSIYKVFVTPNDGYSNGTGTYSNEVTAIVKMDLIDVVNGVYAVLDTGIPSNAAILNNSNNSILTTDIQLDWTNITAGTWTSTLSAIDYSYSVNMRTALRLNIGGNYADTTVQNNTNANISTYFADLKTDPYESDVQWVELYFTNTSASTEDKANFANITAQTITEATNNKLPVYTVESLPGLNSAFIKISPIISLNILNDSDFIDKEKTTVRGNITRSRLYSGNYTLSLLLQYKQNILNRVRGTISTDHPSELYSAYVDNGVNHDLILFNNQSGTQNLTVSNATGTFLDTTNDVIRVASGSEVYFNVSGNNFVYIINNDVNRIVMKEPAHDVYGDLTEHNQTAGYTDNYFDAYIYAGAQTDIKVQLSDPTYVNTPLSMVYYGWLNASRVQNYTDYKYIIIADKNAAVINSTINRPNDTYIYIAVADYADNDQWTINKMAESDWASDYGYNTFIDGIDFGSYGTNFGTRFKQVVDHIKSRDKKVILNTYTTYQEFATYGDAIMKESAFSRWDGDVNSPTYSWEDMTLEKQRADFYSSHNLPVILMSFGDVRDYDKMYFDYMAGAVLYGYHGNNSFRYGQPNFQTQRDYPVKPLGDMLEAGFSETSATDWNRLYANGRVHVNPVNHTAWVDDAKIVNNISFDIYLYSGAAPVGDGTVMTTIHQPNGTYYNLTYDSPPIGVWGWRKITLPTSEYKEHGQYDFYFATRPTSGGYNFLGKSNTAKKGTNSFYNDSVGANINTSPESAFTWTALPIDNNWMVRLNVDYTTELLLDTIVASKITQTNTSTSIFNKTIVLNGTEEYNVPIYSEVINVNTTSLDNVWFKALNGSWVSANLPSTNITDINTSSIITWTETQIDGLTYGVVKAYSDATHWLVRLLFPNNINQEARITEPIILMQNPPYNITLITSMNVTQISSDGTTLSIDVNTTTLKLNSSTDFTLSNVTYGNDRMLFSVSAASGTLNITTETAFPNRNYNLIVDNSIIASGTSNNTGWITFANSAAGVHNYEVSLDIAAPANLAASTGNYWINWTWDAVSNADDYNIWINGTDIESDTVNLYYNATYSAHAQRTISVRGVNTTTQNFGLWSNVTTTIPNNLPVMVNVTTSPDTVYSDGIISATQNATDADSDSLTYTYLWYKDSVSTGITTSTISSLSAGSVYYVDVTPHDGYGAGVSMFSNEVTVIATNTRYASPSGYTVDVPNGQNTVLTSLNTTFANMLAGTTGYITPTFNLNNKGNIPANVSSRFTSFVDTTYGMVSGSNVIPASAFCFRKSGGTWTCLNDDGTPALMVDTEASNTNDNWDIRVIVPSGQAALAYTGTVEMTFSDAV